MSTVAPRRANDRGETLIELLLAISILGVAVVALVGGIGTSVFMSDVQRKEATAGTVVHTYAEAIESGLAASATTYVACAGVSTYASPPGFTSPNGFTPSVTAVLYWNGTAFVSTCSPDSGVQKLSLKVTSGDTRASETLDLTIRKPCRAADAPCS